LRVTEFQYHKVMKFKQTCLVLMYMSFLNVMFHRLHISVSKTANRVGKMVSTEIKSYGFSLLMYGARFFSEKICAFPKRGADYLKM
jgi:hypothetical protein